MSLARAFPATAAPLRAFAGYGLELEYMLVRRDTLDVAPIAEQALAARRPSDAFDWSNELDRRTHAVSATAFACFTTRAQIGRVHDFAARLRDLLR